ncbi:uncharacterized protein N7446_013126 [Penicillium canescens]|uniref:uncharacterized protein n=1 Tax=Penicillium canescens TaxID=5083 RepID=UPI0026E0E5A6|nr:uncharacterized protein N7446_013126 [Penicillium canescens]KAJ6025963.1 hypothetical protein N7444_013642 [Penicillium canescens]KAJ6042060.1 hypothetical protein N7446_013126 [Penicillium canescens]
MALNYFDIPAIQRETSRVPRAGSESVLYGVWNTILTWQFPVQQGYVTRPQDRHTSQAGQRGFSDLHTFQYPSAQQRANKFLIVQCKRTGLETRASTWGEGVQQLDQYLSATHRTRHVNRTPVYGIIAVGMYMRVYLYDDATNSVRDIGDPTVPSTAGRLHLKNDRIAIQQILDHIKANH